MVEERDTRVLDRFRRFVVLDVDVVVGSEYRVQPIIQLLSGKTKRFKKRRKSCHTRRNLGLRKEQ